MADPIAQSISPLLGLSLVNRPNVIEISDAGPTARFAYRGSAAALARACGAADVAVPCKINVQRGIATLWLGPDEWLLLCAPAHAAACRAALQPAIAASAGCLVDISDRNFGLLLSGTRAGDALASACPLDFDLSTFPVGMCTRTLFGKAEVIVGRLETQLFRLEAWRSFAPYITGLLDTCVRGLPAAGGA
jgi:sarcosine oxidase, subunit gamma